MGNLLGDINAKLEVSVSTKSIMYIGIVIFVAVTVAVVVGVIVGKKV